MMRASCLLFAMLLLAGLLPANAQPQPACASPPTPHESQKNSPNIVPDRYRCKPNYKWKIVNGCNIDVIAYYTVNYGNRQFNTHFTIKAGATHSVGECCQENGKTCYFNMTGWAPAKSFYGDNSSKNRALKQTRGAINAPSQPKVATPVQILISPPPNLPAVRQMMDRGTPNNTDFDPNKPFDVQDDILDHKQDVPVKGSGAGGRIDSFPGAGNGNRQGYGGVSLQVTPEAKQSQDLDSVRAKVLQLP